MKNREQILALEGGRLIVEALAAIEDDMKRTPQAIGPVTIRTGTAAPNNAVVGNIGDLYLRTTGGTTTTLYVKESGTANAIGWTAK